MQQKECICLVKIIMNYLHIEDTLLNYANNIINKYNAKEISSLEEAKNTFNIWVYMSKKEIEKDINYETILDDILLYIDENIQKNKIKRKET
jgi:hypothetical protein